MKRTVFLFIILWSGFSHLGVSAQKIEDSKAQEKAAFILEKKEIEALKAKELIEVLNQIPGVSADNYGVRIQGSSEKEVMVIMDNRPLSNPSTGYVTLVGIPASNIERIEIIKGAGAAAYGNNTSGGVILITTVGAQKGVQGSIEISYGTYGTQLYRGTLNHGREKDAFSLILYYERSRPSPPYNKSDEGSLRFNLNRQIEKDRALALSGHYYGGKFDLAGPTYAPTPNAESEGSDWSSAILFSCKDFTSNTYYNGWHDDYKDSDIPLRSEFTSHVMGQDVKTGVKIPSLKDTVIGLNGEHHYITSNNFGDCRENQGHLAVTSGIHWLGMDWGLGLRTSYYSAFDWGFNPEFSLSCPKKNYTLTLNINRSHNTPSARERFYEGTFHKANPDLDMEKATNLSLGLAATCKEISANLTFFYRKITDGIIYAKRGDYYQYINEANMVRKGMDMGFAAPLGKYLKIDLTYQYLIAENEDTDKTIPFAPRHKVKGSLIANLDDFTVVLRGDYSGKYFEDRLNERQLDACFVADLRLSYQWKSLDMYLEVKNLFDNQYEKKIGYPAWYRRVFLGCVYAF